MASIVERADRRIHRISPADPVPETDILAVSMPKSATFAAFVETATKCRATALASPPRPLSEPFARGFERLVIVSMS